LVSLWLCLVEMADDVEVCDLVEVEVLGDDDPALVDLAGEVFEEEALLDHDNIYYVLFIFLIYSL
jgi:hypothetical protein